jgi:hypothetical protein
MTPMRRWQMESELRNLAANKATTTWLYDIISRKARCIYDVVEALSFI